jgi:hypothetical protein
MIHDISPPEKVRNSHVIFGSFPVEKLPKLEYRHAVDQSIRSRIRYAQKHR